MWFDRLDCDLNWLFLGRRLIDKLIAITPAIDASQLYNAIICKGGKRERY